MEIAMYNCIRKPIPTIQAHTRGSHSLQSTDVSFGQPPHGCAWLYCCSLEGGEIGSYHVLMYVLQVNKDARGGGTQRVGQGCKKGSPSGKKRKTQKKRKASSPPSSPNTATKGKFRHITAWAWVFTTNQCSSSILGAWRLLY